MRRSLSIFACVWGTLFAFALCAGTVTMTNKVVAPYLLLPIKKNAPKVRLEIRENGKDVVRSIDVEWAPGAPDWNGSVDLGRKMGRALEFRVSGIGGSEPPSNLELVFAGEPPLLPYSRRCDEPFRAQFHFTPPFGWNNDPNGLSFFNGQWHLFYQFNPYGTLWGNMHWGHAVSSDLVHWDDCAPALYPDELGTMFSGSAVVDAEGTAGFGKNVHCLIFTSAGKTRTQRLAWSSDGRNYQVLPGSILEQRADANRDPKVFWHAPTRRWIMVVYGVDSGCHVVSIFSSPNLRQWSKESMVRGDKIETGVYLYECPDLFELPIEGEEDTRWILTAANRQYAIGTFDGRVFTPEVERLEQHRPFGELNPVYAAQTFNASQDSRRIQLWWTHLRTRLPKGLSELEHVRRMNPDGCSFSEGMSLPHELKLVRTRQGLRLARFPIRELEQLRCGEAVPLERFDGELAEVSISCKPVPDAVLTANLRGLVVSYSVRQRILSVGSRAVAWNLDGEGYLRLRIFVDRMGMEIFSADGLQFASIPDVVPNPQNRRMSLSIAGAKKPASDVHVSAWHLKSIYSSDCMRFMTFNIWGDYFKNPPSERERAQAELIRRYHPDVLALQEVTPNYWKSKLFSRLSDYVAVTGAVAHAETVDYAPLFYNRVRLEEVESGFLVFPAHGPRYDRSKAVTWSVLRRRADGRKFLAFSTHFWWKEEGAEDDAARKFNAQELIGALSDVQRRHPGIPIVGGGDLNAESESPALKVLKDADLVDVCEGIRPDSWHGFPLRGKNGALHGVRKPSQGPPRRFDHLFVSPTVKLRECALILDQDAVDVSDHYPLLLDFNLSR